MLLWALLCSGPEAYAQLYYLHSQPDTFLTELTTLVKSTKLKAGEQIADEFSSAFGAMPEGAKKLFIKNAQLMAAKKLPPHPFFELLLSSTAAAVTVKRLDAKSLEDLLATDYRVIGSYKAERMKAWFGTV